MHVYYNFEIILLRMMTKITTKVVQKHGKIDVNYINTSLLFARNADCFYRCWRNVITLFVTLTSTHKFS